MITAGLVDRAIDEWETEFVRSTVKNTVSALVLVLNEAFRDGIIARNPATDRAVVPTRTGTGVTGRACIRRSCPSAPKPGDR